MNDLIRDLLEQAGVRYSILPKDTVYAKFAELIVKECCQKLETDGMVEVAMELKEHFGVE